MGRVRDRKVVLGLMECLFWLGIKNNQRELEGQEVVDGEWNIWNGEYGGLLGMIILEYGCEWG